MRPYVLKRRDEPVAVINLSDDGNILSYKMLPDAEELAPLHEAKSTGWLKKWWSRRAVPISQGHIKQMLESKGLMGPEDYLVKNLGLSLTDYYWISPFDSGLLWKDVNLYTNDFHDDINIANTPDNKTELLPHYTPNSSLQGTLEKCWTIKDGKRCMIKGNHGTVSAESFNEIIASRLHELQGFKNYTKYNLIEIQGRPYQYGCYSELFTSERLELISAYDVVISKKQRQDINSYEHYIAVCEQHGLKESELRPFLEYQIMTDFILSNRDRHLTNVSVLRDAETLRFVMPAPIYDTGKSMFADTYIPADEKEMLNIVTESFANTELKLLSLVKDRKLVDADKLPDTDYIRKLYSSDTNISSKRVEDIVSGYERKMELFRKWQKGKPC